MKVNVAKPYIGQDEVAAVERVMRSGMLAQGPEVAAFETEFAETMAPGCEAIAVNSGTSALIIGQMADQILPGDEVIVPSFTFAATANSVVLAGGKPVFVDIDPTTFCVDSAAVKEAITSNTRAIMPVHLFGHPAAMSELETIAEDHNLSIYGDAAQAHGATYFKRDIGTFGTFAAYSFYPTKNMMSGEGGMIVTNSQELAHRARLLRNQGMQKRYHNELVGFNMRMSDLHASIGRVQLRRVFDWNERRREIAEYYDTNLVGVQTPRSQAEAGHVYHQYTILVPSGRDAMIQRLSTEFEIGTGVFYPVPNHELPSLKDDVDLPVTASVASKCLSLPVHPHLTDEEVQYVTESVNRCVEENSNA